MNPIYEIFEMCNVIETEIAHGNYPPFTLRSVFFFPHFKN
jgi:hypothetical protein